jgi:hypothetical protein
VPAEQHRRGGERGRHRRHDTRYGRIVQTSTGKWVRRRRRGEQVLLNPAKEWSFCLFVG